MYTYPKPFLRMADRHKAPRTLRIGVTVFSNRSVFLVLPNSIFYKMLVHPMLCIYVHKPLVASKYNILFDLHPIEPNKNSPSKDPNILPHLLGLVCLWYLSNQSFLYTVFRLSHPNVSKYLAQQTSHSSSNVQLGH